MPSIFHVRSRASNITTIACCNIHTAAAFSGFPPKHSIPLDDHHRQVIWSSNIWFIKVVRTLFCIPKYLRDKYIDFLGNTLTSSIALGVIKTLKHNPGVASEFFLFSKIKLNLKHSLETYDFLLELLCESGLCSFAKQVFHCMRADGHLLHNTRLLFLVTSIARAGMFSDAEGMLWQLQRDGIRVSPFVYNVLLDAMVKHNQVDHAVQFFKQIPFSSTASSRDTSSFNIVISGLCKRGKIDQALEIFNDMEISDASPDVVTYNNTLINGLRKDERVDKGHDLLHETHLKRNFQPNIRTYTSIISAYCREGRMEEASDLFYDMTSHGVKPDTFICNALISGFGRVGNMARALRVFEKMPLIGCAPDAVTFNSLIHGYCQANLVDQGIRICETMRGKGLSPCRFTFAILINHLCKLNKLDEARVLLWHSQSIPIVHDPYMYNPLINGLSKAGKLDEAIFITEEMKKRCKPDKMTFTILIFGHCMNGRIFDAISIFHEMLKIQCTPDDFVIKCLATSLFKAGMSDEATQIMKNPMMGMSLKLNKK